MDEDARRRAEGWTMGKDVFATFVGALAALCTAVGPVVLYAHNWMRDRDRAEAAFLVRVEAVERRADGSERIRAEDRRELLDRLARIEGLLLNRPVVSR